MPILPGAEPSSIEAAAAALAAGQLVGLPTETVYGLAARADDDAAVARIFSAKGRGTLTIRSTHHATRSSRRISLRPLGPTRRGGVAASLGLRAKSRMSATACSTGDCAPTPE